MPAEPKRLDRLIGALHHLTVDKEHLLRQMIRFTIGRGAIEPGVPPSPSRRLEYVEQALAPLRDELTPGNYDRLVHAIAVVIGIEARIVLSDICGLHDAAILDTERWAAQTLLAAALADHSSTAAPPKVTGAARRPRSRKAGT